ncbi:acidic phospholipase A2 [Eurytemora carolleeae]|uniref:acidic phospholipase A2 n=1 Tax=Eurytemora carolleeae TaxID=1294199 RepID=UPI000C791330|nr:acidic phospholipase A2 [Eurytemora carolleeae]|eukprot:XP_023334857.1 acidic phospholipase A2-like [Eurytemora affinis]
MIKCGTGCNPLVFKGYGCYCGFLGSGGVVDGIDRCCKMHDWCYTTTTCVNLEYNLPYFVPYKWTCNGGAPYCMAGHTKSTNTASCGHQLCECDREFVECLSEFKCPHKKAMCKSPWRYFQNLFMGLGTGMPMDDSYNNIHGPRHHLKPRNPVEYPKPKFHRNRVNIEVGRV